ncbi:type II toxin-antitoxin system Phd/YefM family antitoxin [Myxococcota bacterium]|nr:type II toxin-antitoxin system Phd/YefM family antitoxin [Myxococcota bacterium]
MTKPLRVSDDIVPLGRFRTDAAHWLKEIKGSGRALIITQNGDAAGVLISPEEFDRMRERQVLLEDVALGVSEINAGQGFSTKEVKQQLALARARRKENK